MCGAGAVTLAPGWGLLGLLVAVPLYVVLARDRSSDRFWLMLAAIVYLGVLLSLTFSPLPLPPYVIQGRCPFVYMVPFHTIGGAMRMGMASPEFALLIGNVAAFVPVGVLAPLLRPTSRPWLTALATGLALSLAVEAGQLAVSLAIGFPYRQADVDDVIVNTIGALTGYGLLILGRRTVAALASDRRLE